MRPRRKRNSRSWSKQPACPRRTSYRTVYRWWNEIEVIIVSGATTGKVEANDIVGIKHIKRTARGYRNPANYKSVILMTSAVRTAA